MKRTAGALMLMAALGGCVTTDYQPSGGPGCSSCASGWGGGPPTIPGVQGPWGQPVTMAAPYTAAPPSGAEAARAMMARSVPVDFVQATANMTPGAPSGIMQAGGAAYGPPQGAMSPAGAPFQPMTPGMHGQGYPPGAVAAAGALVGPGPNAFPSKRTEVRFVAPTGMKVAWFAPTADGRTGFSSNYVTAPGRYNFIQSAIYRLKLSDISPSRPGVELYPTLEVVPGNAKTDAFLAHSAVPVAFSDEDFEQVAAGNYVVKVIYLPEPQFQDLVTTGPDEVVSSRLEPGVDPIAEAHRRGNILLVVRLGNIDLEAPNTPPMDAPSPYGPKPAMPGHGMMPNMRGPGSMAGGPMIMPPNGMMPGMGMPGMGMPGMQQMPPAQSGAAARPGLPVIQPPVNPNVPVSKLPDPSMIQQTQYKAAAAQLATQVPDSAKPVEKKPASNGWKPWWSSGSDQ